MNDNIKRFLLFAKELNLSNLDKLSNVELFAKRDEVSQKINFTFKFNNSIYAKDFFLFLYELRNNKQYEDIVYSFDFCDEQYTEELVIEFLISIINSKKKFMNLKTLNFSNSLKKQDEYNFVFWIDKKDEDKREIINLLFNNIIKYGYKKLAFEVNFRKDTEIEIFDNSINNETEKKIFIENLKKQKETKSIKSKENTYKANNKGWIKDYPFYENYSEIHELYERSSLSTIGEIFAFDSSKTKTGKFIYSISITNFKDGLEIKWFKNDALSEEQINELKIGKTIKIFGTKSSNKFIYLDKYSVEEPIFKENIDYAPLDEKRVELHISSKMNTMDGLIEPEDIIAQAEKFKMPAVAIMDLNGAQGYPKFYSAAKKSSVKPLFGTAFSVINKNNQIVLGNLNKKANLRDLEYISFDIETTGLSPKFNELIEFGAVRVNENLKISEKTQFFVKATKPISNFIVNLTNITNEMLEKDGISLEDALDKIFNLLNNQVLLAHNAKFDFNFLKEKFRQANKTFPNIYVIDTLKISRLLFPDNSKHKLSDLASRVGVVYDASIAHRGDYDAEVLANVWINLISLLEEKGYFTLEQLVVSENPALYKREFAFEISTLVKNQIGLKEQFKMISNCLTTNYYDSPKTFWSDLKKYSNILIGSGTLKSKLLEDYFYSSHEEFLNTLDYFDYIEIPAPQVFEHWIIEERFTRKELIEGLKEIIQIAKSKNKIVVATADVKYRELKDKQIYEVLVYSKGIGNARHYLYSYKNSNFSLPTQQFLTTDEMLSQFSFLNDQELQKEIVIKNTQLIANMCEKVQVIKDDLYKPIFDDSANKLKNLVYETAYKKYGENLPSLIDKRIEAEINPIIKHGFDIVYWISHKLVKKSIDNGYVVGSRGSVGSSLVATLSNISEVNPLPPHYICNECKYFEVVQNPKTSSGFDLPDKSCPQCGNMLEADGQTIPFETFLGFDADKVPDIDLNFSGDFQGEVHNEVKHIFGEHHSFRAGTISTVQEKTAYGFVKNYEEETKKVLSETYINFLTKQIEGVKRTTSKHAGGIMIVPKELDILEFTPVNYPANDVSSDWLTTHFDYRAIHDNLLKLDILGHDNPARITLLIKYTGIDLKDIPKNDPKVIEVFSGLNTLGIKAEQIGNEPTGALGLPEFGTPFSRQMLYETKPQSFSDLIALTGLSHGTNVWLGNAQDLLKEGFSLNDLICCRDDILNKLLEKNVPRSDAFKIMEKVRKGKGVSEEEEDLLLAHNVPQWQIDSMKKIEYMFPRAHAAAYSIMGWWIAWFKVYHPLAFYAAYLTTHPNGIDIVNMIDIKGGTKVDKRIKELNANIRNLNTKEKTSIPILELIREMYARGYNISNIDLEKSDSHEWKIDNKNKCLIPPFEAVDGLGEAVALSIVKARDEKHFKSIEDFSERTTVNKTILQKLRDLGVFQNLNETNQLTLFDF
ncbi:PolC-type DNA polymerase III [Mycoplasmopsis gallinarum]